MTQHRGEGMTLTTAGDLQVLVTRSFEAPRELVYQAFTRPEHLKRWLCREGDVMTVCEVDLRVGGKWRYVIALREGGEITVAGRIEEMGLYGEFVEIVEPERLVQTEAFDEPFFEVMGGGTINTVVFEPRGTSTFMQMTILYKSREARESALATPMAEGMEESFQRLEGILAEHASH